MKLLPDKRNLRQRNFTIYWPLFSAFNYFLLNYVSCFDDIFFKKKMLCVYISWNILARIIRAFWVNLNGRLSPYCCLMGPEIRRLTRNDSTWYSISKYCWQLNSALSWNFIRVLLMRNNFKGMVLKKKLIVVWNRIKISLVNFWIRSKMKGGRFVSIVPRVDDWKLTDRAISPSPRSLIRSQRSECKCNALVF